MGLLLERGRPRREGEGALGVDGGNEGVSGQGGEIGKEAAEAVDRRPSSVRPVVYLVTAAGERSALATTLARSASAASLSVSS